MSSTSSGSWPYHIVCVCVCVCVCFEHVVGLVVDFLTIIWIAKVDDSTNRKREGFL
jgi:hypothetical protein